MRDKFGETSITLGTGMKGGFRERTHENPAALPGKSKAKAITTKDTKYHEREAEN